MPPPKKLRFENFQIDLENARLLRDSQPLPLSPKAFDVLVFFCQCSGKLVSKNELLDAVWPRRFISEGVIKNAIQELRRALDDDVKTPRYIETVHRRGYRFIAAIDDGTPATMPLPSIAEGAADEIVGREPSLQKLGRWLEAAAAGKSAIVFLSGEPGIGKTALIHSFIQRVGSRALCVQGQCVEQYGQSEPYLPLLEAINQLARQNTAVCIQLLRKYAPTWLVQLPWLMDDTDREWLQREAQGVTKDRMLRELGEFLRSMTDVQPVLLVIEDLHWSDHATLDAVTYLSRRKDGARLMILGSYRPADVMVHEHPFRISCDELRLHRLCHELPVTLLGVDEVERYLRRRFAAEALPDSLIQAVFQRTEGLPLFLVRIADEMQAMRSAMASGSFEQVLAALPEGLKHLISLQFERLSPVEKQWLDVAAVCGHSFSIATLAEVAETPLLEIEDWCEKLVRAHHLLRHADSGTDADHRNDGFYTFIHAYYQELAYAQLAPARCVALHGRIGEQLEAAYAEHRNELAAELAVHFERGQLYGRAVQYLHLAAQNALNRHATLEAAQLLQQGIDLLDTQLPDSTENQQCKLELLTLLSSALIATRGYAVPELAPIHDRTIELAERLQNQPVQFFTLFGKGSYHTARGELDVALELAGRLLAMAENQRDPVQPMAACLASGVTLMYAGENREADMWLARGLAFASELGSAGDRLYQIFGQDLLATLLAYQALTQHMLGYADRSLALMQAASDRAKAIGHPYTQAFILSFTIWLYRDRCEPEQVREYLPQLKQLSAIHGFPLLGDNALWIFAGWVSALLDRDPAGIDLIHRALEWPEMSGMRLTKTVYFHQNADACLAMGLYDQGLAAIHSAFEEIAFSGERRYEAESYRLCGELLLHLGDRGKEAAVSCFEKALSIAQAQNARFFELRAACSLARVHRGSERQTDAVQRLRRIYEQFTEGFDTLSLREACTLLAQLEADDKLSDLRLPCQ